MKNDEKAIIAGAGAVLAYFLMEKNKEKKNKYVRCVDISCRILCLIIMLIT